MVASKESSIVCLLVSIGLGYFGKQGLTVWLNVLEYTATIPARKRQRQADLPVEGQPEIPYLTLSRKKGKEG